MPPIGDDLWALGYGIEDISSVPSAFLNKFPIETETPPDPTITPEPTEESLPLAVTATPCPQPIAANLASIISGETRDQLGCPRGDATVTPAAWQPFEGNGALLWRADSNLIYIVGVGNAWTFTGDTWRDGDEPYDPAIVAPNGFYQPVRGFGLVWRERPGVRAALGWALSDEIGLIATIQEFSGGVVWSDGEGDIMLLLLNDGSYQLGPGAEFGE